MATTIDDRALERDAPSPDVMPDRRLEPLLIEIGRRIAVNLDTLAPRIAERIVARVPELEAIEADEPWLNHTASVRANIETVLSLMPYGLGPQLVEAPAVTQERVRRAVRSRTGLDVLLRSYRWGHAELWEAWQAEALRLEVDDLTRRRLLTYSSRVLFAFVDRVTETVAELYGRERETWVRTPAAARAGVVRDLLAGVPLEETTASARLNYGLRRNHVAFVVWDERSGPSADVRALERAAGTVGAHIGHRALLTLPAGETSLVAWCGRYEEFDARGLAEVCELELEPHLRLAVGDPGFGVPGFVRSHREATATRDLMRADPRGRRARRYHDVALASLLVADGPRAADFSKSVLGPLAREVAAMRVLRDTLAVVLEEAGCKVSSARRLSVHQNTIANRVAKIEQLLGHSIDHRQHDLEAALLIERTLDR